MSLIKVELFIHPLGRDFTFEVEKGTTVEDLCLHIKENVIQNTESGHLDWEVLSDNNKPLALDYKLNEPLAKLQIRYSDQLVQQNQQQNNIEQKDQLEEMIEKQVYIDTKSFLNIKLKKSSQLKDLLQFIKNEKNLSGSIQDWVCKSNQRGEEELQENYALNDDLKEIIHINTDPPLNKSQFGRIVKKKQPTEIDIEIKLKLVLEIQDGLKTRNMEFLIDKQSPLESLAQNIIERLSLQDNDVAVDFFINSQQHNNPNVRRKTLEELNIQNDQVIQAKIRWIN